MEKKQTFQNTHGPCFETNGPSFETHRMWLSGLYSLLLLLLLIAFTPALADSSLLIVEVKRDLLVRTEGNEKHKIAKELVKLPARVVEKAANNLLLAIIETHDGRRIEGWVQPHRVRTNESIEGGGPCVSTGSQQAGSRAAGECN